MRSLKKKLSSEGGFTLVEMAIVVAIVGILVAAGAKSYDIYLKDKREQSTRNHIHTVNVAIGEFRQTFGRYPCPSSMTDTVSFLSYGRESDCSDFTLAPNNCANGICTEQSDRTITYMSGGTAVAGRPWVRSGFVPFRELNLPESHAYDGYGNRIKYVVTQHLAVSENFETGTGGIEIFSDSVAGESILEPPASAHFLVLSHGKNGNGAYGAGGGRAGCLVGAGMREELNCTEPRFEARYRLALGRTGASEFDDKMAYFTMEDVPLWQISVANSDDIHQKPPGDVSIRPATLATEPADAGEVGASIRARQNVWTDSFCATDGSTDCFPSSLIAGPLNADPMDMNDDLKCEPGAFIVGIEFSSARCMDEVFAKCPGALPMQGINPDGTPDCPDLFCPTQNVEVCGDNSTLLESAHGTTVTVTGGDNGDKTYRCDVDTWQLVSRNDNASDCTCTPNYQTRNGGCGAGFSGTIPQERTYTCPAGTWTPWTNIGGVTFADRCTCEDESQTRDGSCPSGWDGDIREQRDHTCSPSPSWSAWRVISNTCACNERRQTRNRNCPGGQEGQYQQERFFECPGGSWTGWSDVAGSRDANCTCDLGRRQYDREACPAGYTGSWYRYREITSCPSGSWGPWREDPARSQADNCAREPIRVCEWRPQSSAQFGQPVGIGAPAGGTCECSESPRSCHRRDGPGNFRNYTLCSCE